MVNKIRKAIRLDKSISRWEKLIIKCRNTLKEVKKKRKKVVLSMDDDEMLMYGHQTGRITQ